MPRDETRFTPEIRLRTGFEFHENTSGKRRTLVGGKKSGESAEEGKCKQYFTVFLEQCEIKATFNWRQRGAPLQTSNFLIRLFVRASTTFYLTKKMHFLVNIPLFFADRSGGYTKKSGY